MRRSPCLWRLYVAAFYLFLVRAAFHRRGVRIQCERLRFAALERFHAAPGSSARAPSSASPACFGIGRCWLPSRTASRSRFRSRCWRYPRHRERLRSRARTVPRQARPCLDDAVAARHPGRYPRDLDPRLLLAPRERARGLAATRSRIPAPGPHAHRSRPALLHPKSIDADHRRAAAAFDRALEEAAFDLGASGWACCGR